MKTAKQQRKNTEEIFNDRYYKTLFFDRHNVRLVTGDLFSGLYISNAGIGFEISGEGLTATREKGILYLENSKLKAVFFDDTDKIILYIK